MIYCLPQQAPRSKKVFIFIRELHLIHNISASNSCSEKARLVRLRNKGLPELPALGKTILVLQNGGGTWKWRDA
jgi:hypothetical protein